MNQCRDLENRHHEKLLEICITTLEKSVKNELEDDLPDDVRVVSTPKYSSLPRVSKKRRPQPLLRRDSVSRRLSADKAMAKPEINLLLKGPSHLAGPQCCRTSLRRRTEDKLHCRFPWALPELVAVAQERCCASPSAASSTTHSSG